MNVHGEEEGAKVRVLGQSNMKRLGSEGYQSRVRRSAQ